jgi:hypothetical protein
MSDTNSLISLGDFTKPATVLIEKIAEAVGGGFRPYQIKRVAKAEAEAEKIKAIAGLEISEIQQRALVRMIGEEGKKQKNIEDIAAEALPKLNEDAKPEDIENDWLANFFEKCKLISDKEMQSLWASLLAGEANKPGTFSKRTVEFTHDMDKSDAQLFTNLCSFGWYSGQVFPLVYDESNEIYAQKGITFASLKHLDDIGLVTFQSIGGFRLQGLGRSTTMFYYGAPINIEFQNAEKNDLQLGKVLLTKVGQELGPICGSVKSETFMDYVVNEWSKLGYVPSSLLMKKTTAS